MNLLFTFFTSLLLLFTPNKQNNASNNDAKAKVILDNVSKKYKSYKSIEVSFKLTTEIPNKKASVEEGKVYLKGEMYKIQLGNQEIYCNKTAVWTYLKDINEVQINDYEPNKSEISPANMFNIYQSDYNYITNTSEKVAGITCKTVDLMPKDKSKPYFKIRIWIDANNHIKQLKIFDKNGSRYIYTVTSTKSNTANSDDFYKFDPSKHQGVYIEDLRL